MQSNVATIGDNLPPNDADVLRDMLQGSHIALINYRIQLCDAAERIPVEIGDDDTAGKAGDFIKQVTTCRKNLEAKRVDEKEPYLTLGRAVDGFFKIHVDALDIAKTKAQKPLDNYLKKKADDERRRRQDEAARLQREAQAQADEAQRLEAAKLVQQADEQMAVAAITEQQAYKAEQATQVKPADLAKSRGAGGSLASLRTRWVGEDIDRESIDLEALRAYIPMEGLQKALNGFIAAGGREIKGARIFEKSETVVR